MIDLFQPGAYGRAGGGNQEIPQYQSQAVKWIAWSINADNGSGGSPAVWTKARAKWDAAGILNFPWMHVRSMGDLQKLVQVGAGAASPAIGVNVEDIVGDGLSLQEVAGYLLDFWVNAYERPVHMPTLDWVQNGQGWQHLSFVTAALEIFPGEGSLKAGYNATIVQQCIDHALYEGLKKITLMFKTKGLSPATYGEQWSICHSLFTADDIPPTQAGWAAWQASAPCTKLGDEMPLPPNAKKAFREELASFCRTAEVNEKVWHYSQTRPYKGLGVPPQKSHVDDCSAYVALCFWWAGHHSGHPVSDPLGQHYSGWGNTGTAYANLKAHPAPKDKYRIGDVAIYGSAADTVHMTVCRKEGTGKTAVWSSFGREAGPEPRTDVHYHPAPLLGVFRPEALL